MMTPFDPDADAREMKFKHDAKVKKEVDLYHAEIKYHESMIQHLKDRGPPTRFTVLTDEQEELHRRECEEERERIDKAAY
jgi:hypothetical protein